MRNRKFWVTLLAGILAAVMILTFILSVLPAAASAATSSSEIKQQIEEMEKKNEEMQAELDALEDQRNDNLSEIEDMVAQRAIIEQQAGILRAQIDNMNEQIAAYNVMIADKQEQLREAEARLQALNEENKERIRAMEEDGNLSYWSVLFEANSFSDLLDRLNIVQEIAAADQRRLDQMAVAAEEVEAAKEELVAERAQMQAAGEELEAAQVLLQKKNDEVQELLAKLAAKGEEYEALMEKYEDELAQLEEEIGKAENEYDDAVYREYLATMTTAAPTTRPNSDSSLTGGSGSNKGAGVGGSTTVDANGVTWVVPCDYLKVASAFGWRVHPVYGDWRHHNGVDLAAYCLMNNDGSTDSPIYAARAGVVLFARWSNSAGWYVTIDHLDGYRTTYMHMCSRPCVSEGQVVAAGEILGCIGTTGTSTGDHLHFGVYLDGSPVDPMEYIG